MIETGTLSGNKLQRRHTHACTFENFPEPTMFHTVPALMLGDSTLIKNPGSFSIASVLSVVFLITVLSTIGIVLFKERKTAIESRKVAFFFWLELAYMAMLIAIGAVYMTCWPPNDKDVNLIGGIVPFAIPWFGALGAVLIGLEGVFLHNKEWDSKYNYWHIARPLIGAVLGFVAFFIMVLLIKSSGASPTFLSSTNPEFASTDLVMFYVLAFLVGYREETFRELIKRGTDLILSQTTPAAPTPRVVFVFDDMVKDFGEFKETAANTSITKRIFIKNAGTADLESAEVTIVNDPSASAVFAAVENPFTNAGILARGESKSLLVEFKPTSTGSFTATLTIKGKNMPSQTFTLKGQGTP
jgi:hypothetical protein